MIAILLTTAALATDWTSLQGAEAADPERARLRPFGFMQVAAEGIAARPVTGLASETLLPYEGERAAFNEVGSGGSPTGLSIRRLRVGFRGSVPGTAERVSTFFAAEFGQSGTTMLADGWRPALMDASISLHGPKNLHLRVGQMKLPLSDEALEAAHLAGDVVQLSPTTARLLIERDTRGGAPEGRANGFRDLGVQAFGAHHLGKAELSWAAMISQGSLTWGDVDGRWDGTARVQLAWVPDENWRQHDRDEFAVWTFAQTGERETPTASGPRTRAGGGGQVRRSGFRVRIEGVFADGLLDLGPNPPFAGNPRQLAVDGTAWGTTTLTSIRHQRVEAGAIWSHVDVLRSDEARYRVFDEVHAFGQYHASPQAWFGLDLGLRHGRAPTGSADAAKILDTMGPYAGAMITVMLPG